jgi:hypothetical protein
MDAIYLGAVDEPDAKTDLFVYFDQRSSAE